MEFAAARDQVVTKGLADEIAFRIQAAILEGEFPPGTHLQQDELCSRYGVSRTPVREALRKLQTQHLVDVVPNKGATVRTPTRQELSDVYQLRAELEGFAAELAAAAFDADDLIALDAAQDEMDRIVAQQRGGQLTEAEEPTFNSRITTANETFHGVIHAAAGNERLVRYLEDLQSYFPKDYVWRAVRSADESQAIEVEEHLEIRVALAAQDGAAARRAMSAHIEHAGRLLLSYLDSHGFWR